VNRFTVEGGEPQELPRADAAIEHDQARRLAVLRRSRDKGEFERRIDELKKAAAGSQNMLYPLREALRAQATVGEVCDALRDVWGAYRPPNVY
jgi:methylmalonyl-CoA mutase N-terminal domain/subunit